MLPFAICKTICKSNLIWHIACSSIFIFPLARVSQLGANIICFLTDRGKLVSLLGLLKQR